MRAGHARGRVGVEQCKGLKAAGMAARLGRPCLWARGRPRCAAHTVPAARAAQTSGSTRRAPSGPRSPTSCPSSSLSSRSWRSRLVLDASRCCCGVSLLLCCRSPLPQLEKQVASARLTLLSHWGSKRLGMGGVGAGLSGSGCWAALSTSGRWTYESSMGALGRHAAAKTPAPRLQAVAAQPPLTASLPHPVLFTPNIVAALDLCCQAGGSGLGCPHCRGAAAGSGRAGGVVVQAWGGCGHGGESCVSRGREGECLEDEWEGERIEAEGWMGGWKCCPAEHTNRV